MPKYWGFHNTIHESQINRHHEGRVIPYPGIPEKAGIQVGDVVFLFRGDDYLYGWGTVAGLGEPSVDRSMQRIIEVQVDPRVLVQQLEKLETVISVEEFGGRMWEKKNGVLAYFHSEQATALCRFLPADRSTPPAPPKEIPVGWERIEMKRELVGGQGTVIKVRNNRDGRIGALKQLHSADQEKMERRLRVQREVTSLEVMEGRGSPLLFESNVESWRDKTVKMYVIMEWIDGLTLSEFIQHNKLPIDDAIHLTRSLLQTLDLCHSNDMFHRDLKPENIILRNGKPVDPIIIDFGMASAPGSDEQNIKTGAGQELGNRFLRLPEYAANQHSFSAISDLTLLVGLYFFMITGRVPRQLEDADGRMPHEVFVDSIPDSVRRDARWPRLERFFNVGFQNRMRLRFQTSQELSQCLDRIAASGDVTAKEEMALEIERLNKRRESDEVRLPKEARQHIRQVSQKLEQALKSSAREAKVGLSSNSFSMIEEAGFPGSNMLFGIYISDEASSGVNASHTIRFQNNQYIAAFGTDQVASKEYYRGPAADPLSFEEAVTEAADRIIAALIREYLDGRKAS